MEGPRGLSVLDGRAQVVIGGTAHTLGAGEIVRLPANVPHSVQAEQRLKMLPIMIRSGK